MNSCQAYIQKHGQKFWGNPWNPPLNDPIPQELLDKHPDVITDWVHCDGCGEPLCGKPAPFKVTLSDLDGSNEETFWLCASHYDEFRAQEKDSMTPNWHECFGGGDED